MPILEYASTPTNLSELQIKQVAARQREIIYAIIVFILSCALMTVLPPQFYRIYGMLMAAALLFAGAAVLRPALKFHHPILAAVMTIVAIIPVLGIPVLAVIDSEATNLLRANGVRVGFLGARS